ncbi:MAG: lysine--tRNA ligase, partial [Thermoleophilia bacterium]|nr:lysine--tRNA ligase [Thermoleophilia bacterium]
MTSDNSPDQGSEGSEPSESALMADRRAKLVRLREAGLDPFPHSFPERTPIASVREAHEDL